MRASLPGWGRDTWQAHCSDDKGEAGCWPPPTLCVEAPPLLSLRSLEGRAGQGGAPTATSTFPSGSCALPRAGSLQLGVVCSPDVNLPSSPFSAALPTCNPRPSRGLPPSLWVLQPQGSRHPPGSAAGASLVLGEVSPAPPRGVESLALPAPSSAALGTLPGPACLPAQAGKSRPARGEPPPLTLGPAGPALYAGCPAGVSANSELGDSP